MSYKNDHLKCVLSSHDINEDKHSDLIDKYKTKQEKVKKALIDNYGSKIEKIIYSGSYRKNTAINTKFDMDLCIYFKTKENSFATLKEMYDDVYNFLSNEYKDEDSDLIETREQKVSTGLTFVVDGEDILFDVTAGRKFTEDSDDNYVNLYVNLDDDDSTTRKTNIIKQIDHIIGKDKERKCIKLLKVWKSNRSERKFKIKSFLIELLVIKAYEEKEIADTNTLWERLKLSMEFIKDNIETIKLQDAGNNSNIVTDTLTENEKTEFKEELEEILDKIDKDETKIKHYFPTNPKYPCDEEEDKKGYNHNSRQQPSKISTPTYG